MPTLAVSDLTTTQAPFIEEAQHERRLFITQPYELYSERNHEAWRKLYARMLPRWERYANPAFQKGIESLSLDPHRVPRLEDVNRFLCPLTGFQAKPVSGYVPAFLFFDCLRNREFPTTITIRDSARLDYLPEPDIFHDIAGHVPMHTDQAMRGAKLTVFGDGSQTRSFCYVSDMVEGLVRLSESEERLPVNLGNPDEMTILEFAETIRALLGDRLDFEYRPLPQDDPKQRKPDITRARRLLGWTPKVGLQQGLRETIEHFKAKVRGDRPEAVLKQS